MIKFVNATTGEEIEREMNDDEFAIYQEREAKAALEKAEQAERDAAKQSALNKLTALGLTADEIAALIK